MLPDRLSGQLTDQQQRAITLIFEDWELANLGDKRSEKRLGDVLSVVGPEAFRAIRELKNAPGIEAVEKHMGWPSRTGKVAFSLIADFLISIQSERDLTVH